MHGFNHGVGLLSIIKTDLKKYDTKPFAFKDKNFTDLIRWNGMLGIFWRTHGVIENHFVVTW